MKKCSKSKCSRCLCFMFLWMSLIIGDFFFFFDGYYILEHVHSGPILTIFHSHISRFIEQLASIITPFSFRKNLWFIQCIVVVRHASAQWFQNGTNPPKISSLDVISQTVHITSVSGHCMHFKFKIFSNRSRHKYDPSISRIF